MELRRRLVLAALALAASGLACASVIGLSDFEIVDDATDGAVPDGPSGFGDGSITTADGITVSPTTITFPPANCGTPSTATITIANHGAVQTSYSATIASPVFTIQNGSGYVAPGSEVALALTATGPTNGEASADVIVTTGTAAVPIHVRYTSSGAALSVTPATLDFGTIHNGFPSSPENVTFTNTGTSDVTVTSIAQLGSDFSGPATPFVIRAGASSMQAFTMNAGTSTPAAANATFATDVPLCGGALTLDLHGTRTTSDITVSPSTVDFGDIPCGSPTQYNGGNGAIPTKTVTISNYAASSSPFIASSASHFAVSPPSGTVAAAPGPSSRSDAPLTVTLNAPTDTPQSLSDVFTITVSAQGTPLPVEVQGRIAGVRLSQPNSINCKAGQEVPLNLKNQGNVPACLSYVVGNDGTGNFHLSATSETIGAGGQSVASVIYIPTGSTNRNAQLVPTLVPCPGAAAPAPICGSALSSIQLEGR